MATMPCWGWDASDFDWDRGPMDVDAAVRDGMVFFTHKATEGTKTQHIHYGEAMRRARAAGMPLLGAYMVPRTPGNSGHGTIPQQVDYFLSYLDAQTRGWWTAPEFFIQVDTEHWGYDDVDPRYGVLACDLLRAQTGKWVVHYAPRWAYGNTIGGDHPLWGSSYGNNPVVPYRQAYPGDGSSGWALYSGRVPTILQFGSRVTIGRQPSCDINAYRGTVEQFRAMITGGAMAGEADKAFIAPYNAQSDWVSPTSWMAQAIEKPLGQLAAAVGKLLQGQGVEQAEIEQLMARPAVALTDGQVAALGTQISAVLVARPDNPLGEADQPAIEAAIGQFFRTHLGG